jgi:hypothetical protein
MKRGPRALEHLTRGGGATVKQSIHNRLLGSLLAIIAFAGSTHAQIVINEIMYHPYEPFGVTNRTEYLEILNAGTSRVDLTNYRFDNGVLYDFPRGRSIGPGAYAVICEDVGVFASAYRTVTNCIGQYQGSLNNGGERVTLSRLSGTNWVTVNTIKYAGSGLADGGKRSLELVNPCFASLVNQFYGAWRDSTAVSGTPGRVNSVYNPNPLPVIGDVQHDPPLPFTNSCVTISARVLGKSGPAMDVLLRFRKDASPPLTWSEVAMWDNGFNGDAVARDGVYSVCIPSNGAPPMAAGQLLEFTIKATDSIGVRTAPATNTSDLVSGPYSYLCGFGEDTGYTGEYPTYHILMTLLNRTAVFAQTGGGSASDTYPMLDATIVTADGQVFYNGGVRQRGSTRAYPYSYAVRLPAGASYDGYHAFDFNFQNQFNNFLGFKITAAAGLPSPKVQLMRLWMNGALLQPANVDTGGQRMYLRVERPGDTAERIYPGDTGNGYRSDGDGYRMGDLSYWNTLAEYRQTGSAGHGYACSTGNPYTAWVDLQNLTRALNLPASQLVTAVTNYVSSVHDWARLFAVNAPHPRRQ